MDRSKILSKIEVDVESGHAIWPGEGKLSAYAGTVGKKERFRSVRRLVYEDMVGHELPDGLTFYSKCKVKRCVKFEHIGIQLANHCRNGHEYTEENTVWMLNSNNRRYRECRICKGDLDKKVRKPRNKSLRRIKERLDMKKKIMSEELPRNRVGYNNCELRDKAREVLNEYENEFKGSEKSVSEQLACHRHEGHDDNHPWLKYY